MGPGTQVASVLLPWLVLALVVEGGAVLLGVYPQWHLFLVHLSNLSLFRFLRQVRSLWWGING